MKDFKIPKSWKDVSVQQFQELSDISSEGVSGVIDRLSVLCDVDPEELRALDIKDLTILMEALQFVAVLPSADTFKKRFDLGGKKFAIINFDKVSLGEWVDLETLVVDGAQKNLHKIFAIIYREVLYDEPSIDLLSVIPYDTENVAVNAVLFQKELDIETCYGACLFFSLFGSRLTVNTPSFLSQEMI
jgi:hypothetical protein